MKKHVCFSFFILFLLACPLDAFLFIGGASKEFAQTLSEELQIPIGRSTVKRFKDGEVSIKIHENVEDRHVFIVQSTCGTKTGSVNDHFMELFLLARALKRGHARSPRSSRTTATRGRIEASMFQSPPLKSRL